MRFFDHTRIRHKLSEMPICQIAGITLETATFERKAKYERTFMDESGSQTVIIANALTELMPIVSNL